MCFEHLKVTEILG